jgi:hypothetical protein
VALTPSLPKISRAIGSLGMSAVTLRLPPQEAHCRMSSWNTLSRREAQSRRRARSGMGGGPSARGSKPSSSRSAARTASSSKPASQSSRTASQPRTTLPASAIRSRTPHLTSSPGTARRSSRPRRPRDRASRHPVSALGVGAAFSLGALLAPEPTGVTKVVGLAGLEVALDSAKAGWNQFWYGGEQETAVDRKA